MPGDTYSVFICYRHQQAAFAEEVGRALTDEGCQVVTDATYAKTTTSHRSQSAANIHASDCVIVVLPGNFPEWLPPTDKALFEGFAGDAVPELANEVKAVRERLLESPSKQVMVLLMQTQEAGGRWRPGLEDLPHYFKFLPCNIACGEGDWKDKLVGHVRTSRQLGGSLSSIHVHRDVRDAVEHLHEESFYGRAGCQTLPTRRSELVSEFGYEPGYYLDLKGTMFGPPSYSGASRGASDRVVEKEPVVDVVAWILSDQYQDGWLVGDMGSGKTIALTRAAWRAAGAWRDWEKNTRGQATDPKDAPPLPMLLPCSAFYRAQAEARDKLKASDLVKSISALLDTTSERFESMLRTRKCLLLLDGAEDSKAAARIGEAILLLREKPYDFRVVVTTRTGDLPSRETTEMVRIKSLSLGLREELVGKIARSKALTRARVKQVLTMVREAATHPGEDVLGSPQGLTIACCLARQADRRPVSARFGELVEQVLEAGRSLEDKQNVWRRALQALALERMKHKSGIALTKAVEIVGSVTGQQLAFLASRQGLESLAGVVKLNVGASEDTLEFEHTSFRYFLAAEAVADSPFSRVRGEIPDGWENVVRFLPGILARQSKMDAAHALLAELGDTAELEPDGAGAWLAGLASLVDNKNLQDSPEARAFTRRARNAVHKGTDWPIESRARVLDACGLAARPYLQEFFQREWIVIPELDRNGNGFLIASAPVLVDDYARFLDDPDCRNGDYWKDAPEPALIHEADEGAWYDQLRTPLRPVTGVTWYEAVAYCAWQTRHTRLPIRLPTADEWRIVAQPDGIPREYPWEAGQAQFNHRDSRLHRPSPVGLFPPYCRESLLDFGTNVYEWSRSTPAVNLEGEVEVLGGCWKDFFSYLRIGRPPIFFLRGDRRPDTGFRCLCERPD